ncbi:hypothetical protein H2201_000886 [Coniosporium apollinis]|uniref:SWIRM domain-containing protein n=1 Tax=Coniosporium apollinis TaxID=61459 RepID=A0ABQ9P385_9PEZI|nr:hypothetical protein H2201_000886 [Coniosporium apollinis]
MFSIQQGVAASDGNTPGSHSYLFDDCEDLLSIRLAGEDASAGFNTKDTSFAAFNQFEVYEPYTESGPSSIHPGDSYDDSERGGSHTSSKDEMNSVDSAAATASSAGRLKRKRNPIPSVEPVQASSMSTAPTKHPVETSTPALLRRPAAVQLESSRVQSRTPSRTIRLEDPVSSTPETPGSAGLPRNMFPSAYPQVVKKAAAEPRAKSSIPNSLRPEEFARQCIVAAYSSRLNPFALHHGEYKLLREHISHAQVTIYLNIRNAILRLWTRNPLAYVTPVEAAGCAKETRYFGLAQVAYEWLLRHGYINFGCVEIPNTAGPIPRPKAKGGKRKTIVVIGAGMSGLGCARQIEGLIAQLGHKWTNNGERPPKVIVLEGRRRIGGRVYSHELRKQADANLPSGLRSTAEMGAQIVTGFEHGNPLNIIIRGQLALHYHALRDNTILYDYDGKLVDRDRDAMAEKLYNDILERASIYRHKPAPPPTVEGDRTLIYWGRDPTSENGATIANLEDSGASVAVASARQGKAKDSGLGSGPAGVEKLAGRAYLLTGTSLNTPASESAKAMGWSLKPGTRASQSVDLEPSTKASSFPTLGQTMDVAIKQYQNMIHLTPSDMRLLNWHHANLEYANAVNVNQLSLGGWDQDIGNEFEGEHTEVIGGYQQVPRGLWQCPTVLDVRFDTKVAAIRYNCKGEAGGLVECDDGQVFEADSIVCTSSLGVLKANSVTFDPQLPEWKQGAIDRLGFGLLNKVVLVYDKPFWEEDRDMFGLLNEAEVPGSLDPEHYSSRRGRFYMFWNCIKTSGKPVLIALMAGNAARATEVSSNEELIEEVTARLSKMFAPSHVPRPSEAIITRWKKDPFACGSYSYVGPSSQPGDYDAMARPIGNLFFAGEATCGTHPATVHGAYLSGLRVASEVVESMLGPIDISQPLIPPRVKQDPGTPTITGMKHGSDETNQKGSPNFRKAQDEEYEFSILCAILHEIGERPLKPTKAGVNPFILFTKDHWEQCKAECEKTRGENSKAQKNEVRAAIGVMWRQASDQVKRPYLEAAENARDNTTASTEEFKLNVAKWDREAVRIRKEYIAKNPRPTGGSNGPAPVPALEHINGRRHNGRRQS